MSVGFDISMVASKSALQTTQKQMAIISNNLAHVNSKEYHRQSVDLAENVLIPGRYAYYGSGVHVSNVVRHYDLALETSLKAATTADGYTQKYAEILSQMEDLVIPEGQNYLSEAIQDFANAVQDLATIPESLVARQAVIGAANTIAEKFNRQYNQMDEIRTYLAQDTLQGKGAIKDDIDALNSMAYEMAYLNDQISNLELNAYNGQKANDLRDQRDKIVMEMAKLTEVTVTEENNYKYTITIGGHEFIDGTQSSAAQVDKINFTMMKNAGFAQAGSTTTTVVIPNTNVFTNNELAGRMMKVGTETRVIQSYDPATFTITLDPPPLSAAPTAGVTTYEIYDPVASWNSDTTGVSFNDGEIQAMIDSHQYLVDKMHELHLFSLDFANVVNDVHRTGTFPAGAGQAYDLDGNPVLGDPAAGWQDYTFFFADTPGKMSVGITDPRKIGASLVQTETGDGDNMIALWEAMNTDQIPPNTYALNNDTLLNFSDRFNGVLAVDVDNAKAQAETTESTKTMFQNSVYEKSAVSMDEEMTTMLEVQQAYQAAAKYINVLSQMLDTLVNLV